MLYSVYLKHVGTTALKAPTTTTNSFLVVLLDAYHNACPALKVFLKAPRAAILISASCVPEVRLNW